MSDTTELTEQLSIVQGTDGCAPSVDDGNDVTLLMHKVTVQEVPSNKEHVSSVTHGQTDSGKCTTTGRLLFEENLGFENPDNRPRSFCPRCCGGQSTFRA